MKILFGNVIRNASLGTLIVLAFVANAWAQTAPSVQGRIIDGQTNGSLHGAVVSLEGTSHRAKSGRDMVSYRCDAIWVWAALFIGAVGNATARKRFFP